MSWTVYQRMWQILMIKKLKSRTCYFFDDMTSIENKIKVDEKSYKNILIYHIEFVIIKDFSYRTINSVNTLYLTINKMNGYIEDSNGNKYLTLISTDEGKGTLEKYEELWNEIRDLITSITNNSDNVHEKYMKIKFNSDDDLPLKEQ